MCWVVSGFQRQGASESTGTEKQKIFACCRLAGRAQLRHNSLKLASCRCSTREAGEPLPKSRACPKHALLLRPSYRDWNSKPPYGGLIACEQNLLRAVDVQSRHLCRALLSLARARNTVWLLWEEELALICEAELV